MNENAAVLNVEKIKINLTALITQAIEAQEAREAAKYAEIEETPRGMELTWKTTPEQIARINAGDRAAIDEFYFSNMRRLTCAAYSHIRHNYSITSIASYEDLLQQVYIELRTGVIKLRPFDKAINGAVYRSFRYAPVGGNDTTFIYQDKERGQCQKAAN